MTQFVRLSMPSFNSGATALCGVLERIEGIACRPGSDGCIWIVSRRDPSSAGPIVDELHNIIRNKEDVEAAGLVRMLREVAQHGCRAELWYGSDSAGLPTFDNVTEAVHEMITQASLEPPEIHLALRPASDESGP